MSSLFIRICLIILVFWGIQVKAQETAYAVDLSNSNEWETITDEIIGGKSKAHLVESTSGLTLNGSLSIENNAGFIILRKQLTDEVLLQKERIRVKVKGDGKRYSLRLKSRDVTSDVEYRVFFYTKKGVWVNLDFSLDDFVPVYRERPLKNFPELRDLELNSVSFCLADRQIGNFQLEIKSIEID